MLKSNKGAVSLNEARLVRTPWQILDERDGSDPVARAGGVGVGLGLSGCGGVRTVATATSLERRGAA